MSNRYSPPPRYAYRPAVAEACEPAVLNDPKTILKYIICRKQKACFCAPSTTGAAYAASGAWGGVRCFAGVNLSSSSYKCAYWTAVAHACELPIAVEVVVLEPELDPLAHQNPKGGRDTGGGYIRR